MITCPNCQHPQIEGTLFCAECGALIAGARVMNTRDLPQPQADTAPGLTDRDRQPPVRTGALGINISLHIVASEKMIHLDDRTFFTLGRIVDGQPVRPDIDMTPYEAYGQGVSRLHAAVKVVNYRVFITDLGSSNGTRVNGQKIAPQVDFPLNHGDMVALGKLKIQILLHR